MSKGEKTIVYLSIGIFLFLIYLIVFSNHGLLDYMAFKKKEAAVLIDTDRIDAENRQLENEIQSLKTDEEYIKHIAKQEHEMAEEDELIFKVRPNKPNPDQKE